MAGTNAANAGATKEDEGTAAKGETLILVKELIRGSRLNELQPGFFSNAT